MNPTKLTPALALTAAVVLALAVPTGAVSLGGPTDDPFQGNEVVLAPYDGPNGEYATVGDDGNLSVDITDPGVNNGAQTLVRNVFVIANGGDDDTSVWLTSDAGESVTLYRNVSGGVLDRATIDRRSLRGADNNVTLEPGEHLVVSIAVDTRSGTAVGDTLLNEIELHAHRLGEPSAGGGGQSTQVQAPTGQTGVEVEPLSPNTVVSENGTEEGPEDGPDESFTVEELDPETIPEDPNPGSDPKPRATITNAAPDALTADQTDRLRSQNVDAVTTVDEPVTLDGRSSTVNRTSGVDPDRRIAKAVDITAPPGQEDEDAIVRMEVSRDRLGVTNPANARMGHLTENGWRLLRTEVVSTTPDTVVFEAQTDGFSPFAVFTSPRVSYEWVLPNGTTVSAEEVRSSFDEPGIYNVTLRVTDARGNTDTTQYRVLANDRPEIAIDSPERVVANESTTLRANVTDEVGNVTVTWDLPNGSQVEGRTVNYTFTNGSHDVSATAEDEYGANATAETTITVGPGGALESDLPLVVSGGSFPLPTVLVTVGLLVFLSALVVSVRRDGLPSLPRLPEWVRLPLRRRENPRITAFEDPAWDPRRNRFEIGNLRVEDPKGTLETVEISVQTVEGAEVARKSVELGPTNVYEAAPEYIAGLARADVDPSRKYTVRVRAVNVNNNEDTAVSVLRFLPSFESNFDRGVAAD